MFKHVILAASVLGAMVAAPASAGTMFSDLGSSATFAAPAGGALTFDFNSAAPGFTLANAAIANGTSPSTCTGACSAQPAFSDNSGYLAVYGGGTASYLGSAAYQSVSFYLGSIDAYNTVTILSTAGNVLASFNGSAFTSPHQANGDTSFNLMNRRVTYVVGDGEAKIGGISFSSGANAAEIDNLVFAVPEPSTWVMMFAGFGMIGLAMRSRRRRTNVVYA